VDPAPLGVNLLVYAAVAVTVISGVDYFFGFRRMLASRPRAKPTA
jgi:CDP-diacylglycerol--glycerol-3-phosphate 3-phosphatidyltransferase